MKPLGLPIGSVRALLALVLVGTSVVLAVTGALAADKLFELATVAVAFYFSSRPSQPVS